MNEERIEEIKNQIRELMRQILETGEEPPEFIQDLLLKVIEKASYEIQKLRQKSTGSVLNTPPDIGDIIDLDKPPYPSSNVNAFKYDPRNGTLFVKFHGQNSADSGPIYRYENVPQNIYDVFSKGRVGPKTSGQNQYHRWIKGVTPSLGASLYALIRQGNFSYQRLR